MYDRLKARTMTCLAVFALITAAPSGPPVAPEGAKWKMVWSDEFRGKDVDPGKWESPEYKRRDALWTKRAMTLDGMGALRMRVFKEGDEFFDGCLRTKGKFEKAFGYFEARMQLHQSRGHWPAFWLFNDSVNNVGDEGRDGTEIDIMEVPWLDDRVNFALHWDGYGADHKSKGTSFTVPGLTKGWHTFGLWWSPEEYRFYVDGKELWTSKDGGVCQVPLYIKLSDEAENNGWAGDIRQAKLPDETLVDYVRVYDLFDAASGRAVYPRPAGTVGL